MSHFSVLVIGEKYEEQLAPYQENNMGDCPTQYLRWCCDGEGFDTEEEALAYAKENHMDEDEVYRENPNAKWDWYVVGGRWGGYFAPKPGKKGRIGEPSTFDKIDGDKRDHSRADIIRKGDIDVIGMRQAAEDKAALEYDKVLTAFGGSIPNFTHWEDMLKKNFPDHEKTREAYHSQEAIKRAKELKLDSFYFNLEDYDCTKDEFIKRARDRALATFAVVRNGEWFEKGSMGWWGTVRDEDDNWDEEFNKMFDEIPDDEILVVVDCHI